MLRIISQVLWHMGLQKQHIGICNLRKGQIYSGNTPAKEHIQATALHMGQEQAQKKHSIGLMKPMGYGNNQHRYARLHIVQIHSRIASNNPTYACIKHTHLSLLLCAADFSPEEAGEPLSRAFAEGMAGMNRFLGHTSVFVAPCLVMFHQPSSCISTLCNIEYVCSVHSGQIFRVEG